MNIHSFYKTTNKLTEEYYYGVHKETMFPDTDDYLGSGIRLNNAINKYGADNFIRVIFFVHKDRQAVLDMERAIVDKAMIERSDCYNLCGGGFGPTIFSDEQIAKMSAAKKGVVPWNKGKTGIYSDETKAKMSAANSRRRIPCSPQKAKKISDAHKGRPLSKSHIAALLASHTSGKAVIVRDIEYPTIKAAAATLGETWDRISYRCRSSNPKYKDYYFT